jgi:NADPH:quinone reductase and related Zn-dependent oxidoreductases
VDLVRSIGADHVIDYTKEDFTKGDQRYDVIFDNVNNRSFSDRRRVLTPNGICVLAGIGGAGLHPEAWGRIAGIFKADLLSRFVRQKFVRYGTKTDKADLKLLSDLMQTGKADTRHRPDLQVERDRGGDAVFRRRPRSRKSSYHCGVSL